MRINNEPTLCTRNKFSSQPTNKTKVLTNADSKAQLGDAVVGLEGRAEVEGYSVLHPAGRSS